MSGSLQNLSLKFLERELLKHLFMLLKYLGLTPKQECLAALYLFPSYLINSLTFKFSLLFSHSISSSKVQFGSSRESWGFIAQVSRDCTSHQPQFCRFSPGHSFVSPTLLSFSLLLILYLPLFFFSQLGITFHSLFTLLRSVSPMKI